MQNLKNRIIEQLKSSLLKLNGNNAIKNFGTKIGRAAPGSTPNRIINFLLNFLDKYSLKSPISNRHLFNKTTIKQNIFFRSRIPESGKLWRGKMFSFVERSGIRNKNPNLFNKIRGIRFKSLKFSNPRYRISNRWTSLFRNFRNQISIRASDLAFNLRSSLNHQAFLNTISEGKLVFLKFGGVEGPHKAQTAVLKSHHKNIVSDTHLDGTQIYSIRRTLSHKGDSNKSKSKRQKRDVTISPEDQKKPSQVWSNDKNIPTDKVVLLIPFYAPLKNVDNINSNQEVNYQDLLKFTEQVQRVNQDQILYINRLLERLTHSQLDLVFINLDFQDGGSIAIIFNSISQVGDSNTVLGLLYSWGMDLETLGAKIKTPVKVKNPSNDGIFNNPLVSYQGDSHLSPNRVLSDDELERYLDSSLFSLITDDIVDPDELHKYETFEFINCIESAPSLTSSHYTPSSMVLF
ncbi:hypothetical protein AYI68_g4556 [Smittium mucronatum]|uniref:Uncharacterized protein n=1 Tax=Smittium mucronatum TaxID=133383 RepID=A0A1R0GWR4_9FUNG|nr:hypothetical protein AYI68_g4556 [Smittium mucronatum]